MNSINLLSKTEKQIIEEYSLLIKELNDPQIKTSFQNIIATHRNNLNKLKKLLGEKNEE